MTARIAIDPNARVRGNLTLADFDDVENAAAMTLREGEDVTVYEPESGAAGRGQIAEIDYDRGLIFLSVAWKTLTLPEPPVNAVALVSKHG